MNPFDDVYEFHEKFGCYIGKTPSVPDVGTAALRENLLREEFRETIAALQKGDLVEIADGLADLIYVAAGLAVSYGIPLDEVWEEVHRSNMAKEGGATREDGKILKPAGWVAPDVAGVLRHWGLEAK